jgi:hypothetical protein
LPVPVAFSNNPAELNWSVVGVVPDSVDIEVSEGDEDGPWVHTAYEAWGDAPIEVAGDLWYRIRGVSNDLVPQTQMSNAVFVISL